MKIILALLLFVLPCLVFAAPPADQGYTLTWSDEFNGAGIDANTWSFDTGCTYDDSYEYYSPGKNVFVENGAAVLEARKEPVRQRCGNYYTSCKMNTMGKAEFKYGYMEIRMKSPKGDGPVPEIWMMGSNYSYVAWPTCGEIDLCIERTGSQLYNGTPGDNCFVSSCDFSHGPGTADYRYLQHDYSECLCDDYHLYAIEWDSLKIQYFFDDQKFWEYDSICQSVNFATFHQPFFFIANITIGGSYQGNVIDTTIFPQRMYIDYIRVYQKSTPVINTRQKRTLPELALFNSSRAGLKVYDLQGRFVGDLSGLSGMTEHDGVLFVKAVKSRVPQGVSIAAVSSAGQFINEKVVIRK